jgi:hypothetical protein
MWIKIYRYNRVKTMYIYRKNPYVQYNILPRIIKCPTPWRIDWRSPTSILLRKDGRTLFAAGFLLFYWLTCYSNLKLEKILLHIHPLLGNRFVNKFPRRQSVVRLRNNSDKRRSVFFVIRAMPSAKQQNCKHVYDNRCFLWISCRRIIGESEGSLQ